MGVKAASEVVVGKVVSRSVLRGVDDEASQTRLLLHVVELAEVERIDVYTWAVEVVTSTRDDIAIGERLYTRADLRQREVSIPAEGVGVKDVRCVKLDFDTAVRELSSVWPDSWVPRGWYETGTDIRRSGSCTY